MGRYSNLCDQGERLQDLLKMIPEGPRMPLPEPRQVQRRLGQQEADQLIATYLTGATLAELAEEYGIHRTTATEILERAGVPRRPQPLSPTQIETATFLYESGLSLVKVSTRLGCNAETLRTALIRSGVKIRKRRGW
jgi:lambda repressor-like predicted transcriptional regulator